jgi:hypothetical protein
MKAEMHFVQGDGLDDAKEAIEINEVDVVRQDFALISLKAKNKVLNLFAEKSFGARGKDDDTEEEAEAEVGTSAEQEKSPADNTNNTDMPDMVEGDATGDDDQGQDSICRQVMDQRDDDSSSMSDAPEETNKPVENEEVEMEISENEAEEKVY